MSPNDFVAIHYEYRGIGKSRTRRFHMLYATGVIAESTGWKPISDEMELEAVQWLMAMAGQRGQKLRAQKMEKDTPLAYMLTPISR